MFFLSRFYLILFPTIKIFYALKSRGSHMLTVKISFIFKTAPCAFYVEFSQMRAICRPNILEVRRNHNNFLYFHALLSYFGQSE